LRQKAQALLRRNGCTGGAPVRNQFGSLLKGLLRCCAMTPSHTKKGVKCYRYYVCPQAQKRGWQVCPSKSIPTGEVEQFVVELLKCIGRDEVRRREVLAQARTAEFQAEQRVLEKDLAAWHGEVRKSPSV
jgi:site-specific DNA recombinase